MFYQNSFEVLIMTKRIFALSLTISVLIASVSTLAAQTGNRTGSWDTLDSYLNNEVAVKAEDRKTVFGFLISVSADAITVRTADKNNVAEVSLRRENIEKIWLAELNGSSRNTLKGAGFGAAIGAGIGAAALLANRDERGGAYGAAVPFYAAVGAVFGGVAGFFVRNKNKKERLIYRK
jgi:small nuclear ribonucleoprotein (snRNP)-like protein